jgi:outer membrane receptor protein involved in Fe transport
MEVNWSNNKIASQPAPSPAVSFVAQSVDHPLLSNDQRDILANNFDPAGNGIAQFFLLRRLSEVGPRQFDRDSDSIRTAIIVEGLMFERFNWEAYYTYSKTDNKEVLNNTVSNSRLLQSLITDSVTGGCLDPSGGCIPITLLGHNSLDAAGVDFIRLGSVANFSEFKERVAALTMTGQLIEKLDLQTAVGLEWRQQDGTFFSSDNLKRGDAEGFSPQDDVKGSLDVWVIYAEFLMPLVSGKRFAESLNLEAGFRYSDYSDSDSTTTWKAGIDWQVNDWLRMRAMQQRAI